VWEIRHCSEVLHDSSKCPSETVLCNTTAVMNRSTHLSPCHDLQLPPYCIPSHKHDQEECGDGSEVASVGERVGNTQETCAQTIVYQEEKTEECIHCLGSFGLSVSRPGPAKSCHSYRCLVVAALPTLDSPQ